MDIYKIFYIECKICGGAFSEEIEQMQGPVNIGDFVLTRCPWCKFISENEIKGVHEKDS